MTGDGRPNASKGDILVVDDTPANLQLLTEMLTARGYSVRPVPSGRLALKVVEYHPPDLILLDISMPDMNGYEVCEHLRSRPASASIPIIFISALQETGDKLRAFQEGGVDYITKPFRIEEVEARVATHLRLRSLQRQLERAVHDLEVRNAFIRQVFGRYVSDELATQLLETPQGLHLGGERRHVTVLMADLRGFTSLAEGLTPEQVVMLLNTFLGTMAEIIIEYGGVIDEFIGDAILAIFGAPLSRPGDTRRATACALAMQLSMPTVNGQIRALGLPEITMGIGINTGDVVAGNIGSLKRAKYGVIGSPVNLTARIEAATLGGQILVSEDTLREAGENVMVAGSRTLHPKGISTPVVVFEVQGLGGEYSLHLPEVHGVQPSER